MVPQGCCHGVRLIGVVMRSELRSIAEKWQSKRKSPMRKKACPRQNLLVSEPTSTEGTWSRDLSLPLYKTRTFCVNNSLGVSR